MVITLPETLGWVGSILYVIAYLLLTLKKVTSDNALYHVLNIAGAVGLIVNAFHWKDFPSMAVNIIWLIIGSIAIIMIIRGKQSHAG
jgi:hypothetical protein